ncbi:wd-repeat protein [Diplodia corticola]|uniref:Wd-repeat protein n=1 Tax=Diplodia corticola TaxID=236234 RepID=A0A1J9QS84_9PEZI|nr:wd-repeat protein [Diplodia corticola]OJD31822.1 wd-repeat protein [Diplodia corticola]
MPQRDCEPSRCSDKTRPKPGPGNRDVKGMQGSAYDKALKSLTPEEQSRINTNRFRDASQLLRNLSQANDKSYRESGMRRGMEKLKPKIKAFQAVADTVGIFGELEPAGSLSIVCGLTSAACSAGIALADAADNLDAEVKRLFDLAPRLIQCNELASCTKNPELIRNDLVRVYTGVFKFYLVATKILDHEYFPHAIRKYRNDMTEAVEGFSSYWQHFLEGVQLDTLDATTETLDIALKSQIAEILERECAHEVEYRPPTPAAGTCQWLSWADGFKLWHQPAGMGTHFLTMFGAMGSGKTVATAYLANHLESEKRTVIRYYVHNDGEMSKPTNIYCSLIRQFLSWHPEFEARFWRLLKEHNVADFHMQARRPEVLRRCFVELLGDARKRVCILLDALDALDPAAREELGQLFRDLLKLECQAKVFLTSQPDSQLKKLVPGKAFEISSWRKEVGKENHRIAEHLVGSKWLTMDKRYCKEDQHRLIKGISELADSSPLMVYLNAAHADALIRHPVPRTVDEVLHIVRSAPSGYSKIPQKWAEIRKQVLERLDVGRDMIDPLLRFLAVAARPVTIREACAFVVYDTQDGDTMPRELDAHGQRSIVEWIRPFVTTDDEPGPESVLRLYHNSLQQLIILQEPSTWAGTENVGTNDAKKYAQRKAQMNGELASKCVRYLCLPECSKKGFIESGIPHGAFFTYAACTWQHHLAGSSSTTTTARPTPQQVSCIMAICRPNSAALRNWTDQNARHEKTFLPPLADLDPLVVAVHFRHDGLTAALLDRPDALQAPSFAPNSARTALACALQTERFTLAAAIVDKAGARLRTLETWTQLMQAYSPAPDFWAPKPTATAKEKAARKRALDALEKREQAWRKFLDPVIPLFLPEMTGGGGSKNSSISSSGGGGASGPSDRSWAGAALDQAVSNGCLSVARTLLSHGGARNPAFHHALLGLSSSSSSSSSSSQPINVVATAARRGDLDMLHLLLAQPGVVAADAVPHVGARVDDHHLRPPHPHPPPHPPHHPPPPHPRQSHGRSHSHGHSNSHANRPPTTTTTSTTRRDHLAPPVPLIQRLAPDDGSTVYHAAARMTCAEFRPGVFAALKAAWPEGSAVLDDRGRHWRDLLGPAESEMVG